MGGGGLERKQDVDTTMHGLDARQLALSVANRHGDLDSGLVDPALLERHRVGDVKTVHQVVARVAQELARDTRVGGVAGGNLRDFLKGVVREVAVEGVGTRRRRRRTITNSLELLDVASDVLEGLADDGGGGLFLHFEKEEEIFGEKPLGTSEK
ncbi:hypothetical protein PFISCL1PPCAC_5204, partial [Pristionchus fissidentatus]